VARAYRDFSRTAAGITADEHGKERKRLAHEMVEQFVREALAKDWTEQAFDNWHMRACASIVRHYSKNAFPSFSIGQAQKWLNMSIKYILSLIEADLYELPRPSNLWTVAHAPLDDFILTATGAYGGVRQCYPWSRIVDYPLYMSVQSWIRSRYPAASALDAEFHIYNDEADRRRTTGLPDTR